MKKILLLLLLLSSPVQASFLFTPYVGADTEKLVIEFFKTSDYSLQMKVKNTGNQPVRCTFNFHNGPEQIRKRIKTIKARKKAVINYKAKRKPTHVRVYIDCQLLNLE